jgi:3-deoxy-D-arabino-heptulosonate 7-phosphate (DAHP) synthase
MLKFIELWNGRKLINSINPMEMPIIRKLLTLKWLQWVDNKISWQEMLF